MGQGTFVKIESDAAPLLYDLAQTFPKAFSRSLKSLGFTLKNVMQDVISSQGSKAGQNWADLSLMQKYKRMDLLKTHGGTEKVVINRKRGKSGSKAWASSKGQSVPNAFNRWGKRKNAAPYGKKMRNAIRYKMQNDFRVDIGGISASASRFLNALQSGKRGSKGALEHTGQQPITPAMRRAFWALGIPISKNTTQLEQQPRQLIQPVFQHVSPQIEGFILSKLQKYLNEGRHEFSGGPPNTANMFK